MVTPYNFNNPLLRTPLKSNSTVRSTSKANENYALNTHGQDSCKFSGAGTVAAVGVTALLIGAGIGGGATYGGLKGAGKISDLDCTPLNTTVAPPAGNPFITANPLLSTPKAQICVPKTQNDDDSDDDDIPDFDKK